MNVLDRPRPDPEPVDSPRGSLHASFASTSAGPLRLWSTSMAVSRRWSVGIGAALLAPCCGSSRSLVTPLRSLRKGRHISSATVNPKVYVTPIIRRRNHASATIAGAAVSGRDDDWVPVRSPEFMASSTDVSALAPGACTTMVGTRTVIVGVPVVCSLAHAPKAASHITSALTQ